MATAVIGKTGIAFRDQGNAYRGGVDDYVGVINAQKTRIETAMSAIANFIKNFKYPTPPTPPIPKKVSASGDPGPFGLSTVSFTGAPLSELGGMAAFAADGIPDYAGATGGMMAYAAAATPLIDLFGGRDSVRLTTVQERALTVDLRFGGADFSRMFDKPIAGLERFANSIWETAKFERRTAEINRDTAEILREGGRDSGTSMYDLARGKKRRG